MSTSPLPKQPHIYSAIVAIGILSAEEDAVAAFTADFIEGCNELAQQLAKAHPQVQIVPAPEMTADGN